MNSWTLADIAWDRFDRTKVDPELLRIFDALVPLWRIIDEWLPWPAISIIGIFVIGLFPTPLFEMAGAAARAMFP